MKKEIRIMFVVLALVLLVSGCSNPAPTNEMDEENTGETGETQIIDEVMLSLSNIAPQSPEGISDVQLGFNLELLKKLGEVESGNLFYSSMSINAAMTMAYFGADGETRQEISDVLGYGDMDIADVAAYQKYLLASFKDSGDTTFTSANSIWIDDKFEAKKSYIDTMVDLFTTQVTNLDLQTEKSKDEMNAWIDKATNGMIEKLFEKGDNSLAEAKMVLMNAIYFNGNWSAPFDPEMTFDAKFGGVTKTSDIKMMSSSDSVMGSEGKDYASIMLPYGEDERFAMVAVLPNDINNFVQNLTTESLRKIISSFENKEDPIIQIPRFEMEEKLEIGNVLKSLGIEQAFSENADFSLMADASLMIDEVLHKAKIKVDEEGTEAAAVTGITMKLTSIPVDQFVFIADKPFLIFIVDTENDLVLFTGKIMDLG